MNRIRWKISGQQSVAGFPFSGQNIGFSCRIKDESTAKMGGAGKLAIFLSAEVLCFTIIIDVFLMRVIILFPACRAKHGVDGICV